MAGMETGLAMQKAGMMGKHLGGDRDARMHAGMAGEQWDKGLAVEDIGRKNQWGMAGWQGQGEVLGNLAMAGALPGQGRGSGGKKKSPSEEAREFWYKPEHYGKGMQGGGWKNWATGQDDKEDWRTERGREIMSWGGGVGVKPFEMG